MNDVDLPLVLVSHSLPAGWLDKLAGRCRLLVGPPAETLPGLAPELEAHLPEAAALFTLLTVPITESLLHRASHLRVVSNMAVGVDNIDLAACTRHGIPVGHTPGVLTEGTADLTLALLLAVARRLPQASSDARAGRWTIWSPTGWLGADLAGATLGIVGMGQIGQAVAQRAKAFGLNLVYSSRSNRPLATGLEAVRLPLADLLAQSDFVSLHLPLNAATHHLLNAETLRLMKPTAILLNVARGPIVDTAALVQALTEGWIQAAGLDVTDPEPLPPDHPLYQLPNCLVLPHIGSATWNTRWRMAERAGDNILAGLAGRPLPYCANPAVYSPSHSHQ